MTKEEIRCANCIIERAIFPNALEAEIVNSNFISPHIFKKVAAFLKDEGLIEVIRKGGWAEVYELTNKGHKLYESRMKIEGYLEMKEQENIKQAQSTEMGEQIKLLQYEDLKRKVNEMNQAQLDFWKAQKEKNVQTTIIAIISALFSLVALMKSWGYF